SDIDAYLVQSSFSVMAKLCMYSFEISHRDEPHHALHLDGCLTSCTKGFLCNSAGFCLYQPVLGKVDGQKPQTVRGKFRSPLSTIGIVSEDCPAVAPWEEKGPQGHSGSLQKSRYVSAAATNGTLRLS
ncbi:unnamed protein product, partial [Heterosigma akashiwo]